MEYFTPSESPIHETQRLPVAPPRQIIGRNQVLGQAFTQIRANGAVLLHGPGGVGKSALAATLASAFTTFPGGVLWWSVDRDSLEQMIVRVGRAFAERNITGAADPLAQADLARTVLTRDHKPLIVIDGPLDQDVAREFVRKIAAGVPLIMTAEQTVAGPWVPFAIGNLPEEDAVSLFIQAAHLEQVSALMRADIQGVCNALEGLPLAIVLAGRHVLATEQTPGEFLGALTSASLGSSLPGLHTIFHQLPDAMQGILLTMGATFAGQASTTLLEYLQFLETETVTRVMNMLVTRGLVQRLPAYTAIQSFQMHPVVHHYMYEWLRDTERLESTVERVVEGILAYAEQYGHGTLEARANLVVEMPNIRGLARFAGERGDVVTLQRLIAVLEEAFGSTDAYGYELHVLRQLAEGETETGAVAQPVEPAPAFLPPEPAPAPEELQMSPVEQLPLMPESDVQYDTSPVEVVSEKPAVERRPPERIVAAEEGTRSVSAVLADLLRASQVAREAGNRQELARALSMLGQVWMEQGRRDQAEAAYVEALSIFEEVGDSSSLLPVLESLASLALDAGDLEKALIYTTRAENQAAQGDDPIRQGHLLALLGDIRLELGEYDEAVETYVRAIETLQSANDMIGLGVVQTKLGIAHLDHEDFTRAVAMLSAALDIFRSEERLDYQERVLGSLGTAYGSLGQWQDAVSCHQGALAIARDLDDLEDQERQLANLAYIAQAQGDREGVIASFRAALDLAYRSDNLEWKIRYLDALGRLLMDDVTQVGMAVMCLEEAEALAPDEERMRWLQRARKRRERVQSAAESQAALPESIAAWAADESG